jgi:hypothetical protein
MLWVQSQCQSKPKSRAANALLDSGWGKAAQLVAIDGEIRQLVEVKLNVVQPKTLDASSSPVLPASETLE